MEIRCPICAECTRFKLFLDDEEEFEDAFESALKGDLK